MSPRLFPTSSHVRPLPASLARRPIVLLGHRVPAPPVGREHWDHRRPPLPPCPGVRGALRCQIRGGQQPTPKRSDPLPPEGVGKVKHLTLRRNAGPARAAFPQEMAPRKVKAEGAAAEVLARGRLAFAVIHSPRRAATAAPYSDPSVTAMPPYRRGDGAFGGQLGPAGR